VELSFKKIGLIFGKAESWARATSPCPIKNSRKAGNIMNIKNGAEAFNGAQPMCAATLEKIKNNQIDDV